MATFEGIPTVHLRREVSADDGTFGRIQVEVAGELHDFHTLELPWRGNRKDVSCIPAGKYQVKYGPCGLKKWRHAYRLEGVTGRSGILIHPGNWAGDKAMGLRAEVQGCILLGESRQVLKGQRALKDSVTACVRFEKLLKREPFWLVISDSPGVVS